MAWMRADTEIGGLGVLARSWCPPLLLSATRLSSPAQFKTRQANGILLYNGGRGHDFLAVELVSGHVHFLFDLGDGPVRLHDTARQALNDNRWHSVTISRPGPREHSLLVDDVYSSVTSKGRNENLDLDGLLYVGGYLVFLVMFIKTFISLVRCCSLQKSCPDQIF